MRRTGQRQQSNRYHPSAEHSVRNLSQRHRNGHVWSKVRRQARPCSRTAQLGACFGAARPPTLLQVGGPSHTCHALVAVRLDASGAHGRVYPGAAPGLLLCTAASKQHSLVAACMQVHSIRRYATAKVTSPNEISNLVRGSKLQGLTHGAGAVRNDGDAGAFGLAGV